MALSYVTYTGNGTQTDYTLPFTYLSQSDVFVFVNGVSLGFTWINTAAIRLVSAPQIGAIIKIRRSTPITAPPVNFTDGSVLLEADLDTLTKFTLYLAQEGADIGQRITDIENTVLGLGAGGLPGALYIQRASGTGSTTAFPLGMTPLSSWVLDVYINGVYQHHDTFTVGGATLTFSEAPPLGSLNIEIRITSAIAVGVPFNIVGTLPTFASNVLALAGGISIGGLYRNADQVCVVH